jgi:hypothetical protein
VDQVVGDAFACREREQVRLELREMRDDRVLLDQLRRTGGDIDHAGVRAEGLYFGRLRRRPPGEDVDRIAARTQLAAQLAHIDVHAASLAPAGSGERRRMHAEHGDPSLRVPAPIDARCTRCFVS